MSDKIVTLTGTQANFDEEVKGSDKLVLVDFWAPWCGPCKAVAPYLAIMAENRDDVKVCKLNVDEHKEIHPQYGVRGIPAMLLFKGGELVGSKIGAVTQAQLNEFVDEHVG